jgi:outer membrane protein assembly factor BamB
VSPPLIDRLPADGLKPVWLSENIHGGGNGGWGSPSVANGKVFVFSHYQVPKKGVNLPPPKYPVLKDDERKKLPAAELEEYEKSRQAEERTRRISSHDAFEVVYCLDATNGKTLWKNEKPSVITDFFHSGTPTVFNERLYVLGANSVARCIDAEGGKTIWETPLSAPDKREYFMSSFAVADGIAAILAGHLIGLDAEDGQLVWEGDATTTQGTHSSPAVWHTQHGDRFIVNVAGQETICVIPRDGRELWRVESQSNLSTPVIAGDKLITLGDSRKKGLRCFDMTDQGANLCWAYQRIADKGSSPLVMDGFVYAQGEQRLACLDLETGAEAWTAMLETENPQYTSLVAADQKVFYASRDLTCFKANSADYDLLYSARFDRNRQMGTEDLFRRRIDAELQATNSSTPADVEKKLQEQTTGHGPLDCASPAISQGRLYIRLKNGIACYDLRSASEVAGLAKLDE